MSGDTGVQAKVDQLAKGFLARLPARLDKIDEAFAACRLAPGHEESRQELYRLLHSLGGAAGTFGVAAVGAEARRIELLIEQGGVAAQIDTIAAGLGVLRRLAAEGKT